MKEVVDQITKKVFGVLPSSIEEIRGKGVVNLVCKVTVNCVDYILRMQKGGKALKTYQREKWCMDEVSKINIPTPKCIAIGEEVGHSFSFQEFIEGVDGRDLPKEAGRIWLTLGQYAKKFNAIPAPDCKFDLDYVDDKLFGDNFFQSAGVFSSEKLLSIKKRVNEVRSWQYAPTLCHGNLHLSNVVVHPSGAIYLVDWGTSCGHRAPHGELTDLFTWNTGKENIAIFLKGYEYGESELAGAMRDIQTLVLIRLLVSLRWKMEGHSRKDETEFVRSTSKAVNEIADFDSKILFSKNI